MIVNGNIKGQKSTEKFECKECDYITSRKSQYTRHLSTDKHKMIINGNIKVPKSTEKFECKNCDYITSRKSHYDRHLTTDKHKMVMATVIRYGKYQKVPNDIPSNNFVCTCGRQYKYNSGLCRHQNLCKVYALQSQQVNNDVKTGVTENINTEETIIKLLKQNTELQSKMVDMMKTTAVTNNNTTNTTNNNVYNKTFNLQFFLNDKCKNAMNIMDFIHNLNLKIDDLKNVGELGYVEGITNIIVNNLNDMDITCRPIHCTDIKRDILYIKDEDKWNRDGETKPKMRNIIKHVAHKNTLLLGDYKTKNPDYNNSSSKTSDNYEKILIESMGGKGDNDKEKEDKIIKNIAKGVFIDKNTNSLLDVSIS
jgi:hypothetical protein